MDISFSFQSREFISFYERCIKLMCSRMELGYLKEGKAAKVT